MYISIDLGGTNTRIAGSIDLSVPAYIDTPLRWHNSGVYEKDLRHIIDACRQMADGQNIKAIGIGAPGTPNKEKTQIASARNMTHWENKPLVLPISEELGCQVFYDNDAIAAGLGEAFYGGQLNGDFDCLIWGTGIGGAAVRHTDNKDKLYVSKLIWKTHFSDWEADCGGAQLTNLFAKSPENFSILEWEEVAKKFKQHLAVYISAFKPQAIIFVGGLAVKHKMQILKMSDLLNSSTSIKVTEFGNDSGLIGGFGLIKQGLAN